MEIRDREVNIGSSIFDYEWLDEVQKPQDVAILFVVYDMMRYFDKDKLKLFLDAIWKKYPGLRLYLMPRIRLQNTDGTEACSWVKQRNDAAGEHR